MILNSQKQIMDVSPTCISMLGITYERLNKKQIFFEMTSLFPQLFQESLQSYMSKAGSPINYHLPHVVEIDSKQDQDQKEDMDEELQKRDS
mmetsp:Transcript_7082/g.5337  ORF Transcript_7082/g.5337 Transcript_7082/m.5337 type:complete len:91 (-) Transcript_7082:3058-3330(-)